MKTRKLASKMKQNWCSGNNNRYTAFDDFLCCLRVFKHLPDEVFVCLTKYYNQRYCIARDSIPLNLDPAKPMNFLPSELRCPVCRKTDRLGGTTLVLSDTSYRSTSTRWFPSQLRQMYDPAIQPDQQHMAAAANTTNNAANDFFENQNQNESPSSCDIRFEPSSHRYANLIDRRSHIGDAKFGIAIHCTHCQQFAITAPACPCDVSSDHHCISKNFLYMHYRHLISHVDNSVTLVRSQCARLNCNKPVPCQSCNSEANKAPLGFRQVRNCTRCHGRFCTDCAHCFGGYNNSSGNHHHQQNATQANNFASFLRTQQQQQLMGDLNMNINMNRIGPMPGEQAGMLELELDMDHDHDDDRMLGRMADNNDDGEDVIMEVPDFANVRVRRARAAARMWNNERRHDVDNIIGDEDDDVDIDDFLPEPAAVVDAAVASSSAGANNSNCVCTEYYDGIRNIAAAAGDDTSSLFAGCCIAETNDQDVRFYCANRDQNYVPWDTSSDEDCCHHACSNHSSNMILETDAVAQLRQNPPLAAFEVEVEDIIMHGNNDAVIADGGDNNNGGMGDAEMAWMMRDGNFWVNNNNNDGGLDPNNIAEHNVHNLLVPEEPARLLMFRRDQLRRRFMVARARGVANGNNNNVDHNNNHQDEEEDEFWMAMIQRLRAPPHWGRPNFLAQIRNRNRGEAANAANGNP